MQLLTPRRSKWIRRRRSSPARKIVFGGTNLEAVAPEHPAADAERDQRIRAEQVRLLFRSPLPQLANIINAAILSAVLWDFFPQEALVAWLGLMAAVTLVRLDLWARYRRVKPRAGEARRWGHLYVLWSGLTACLWGLSASSVFIALPFCLFRHGLCLF